MMIKALIALLLTLGVIIMYFIPPPIAWQLPIVLIVATAILYLSDLRKF